MSDDRPESKLLFQDFGDAHAFGLTPDKAIDWCLAKLAGMDYEDFLDEAEEVEEDLGVEFTLIATIPPRGSTEAEPIYTEEGGVKYAELPLLYQAARPKIKFRRGTVRDAQETRQGDAGPPAQQRLLERLSGWTQEEIRTISLYDWNAIQEAKRNFTIRSSPGALPSN